VLFVIGGAPVRFIIEEALVHFFYFGSTDALVIMGALACFVIKEASVRFLIGEHRNAF